MAWPGVPLLTVALAAAAPSASLDLRKSLQALERAVARFEKEPPPGEPSPPRTGVSAEEKAEKTYQNARDAFVLGDYRTSRFLADALLRNVGSQSQHLRIRYLEAALDLKEGKAEEAKGKFEALSQNDIPLPIRAAALLARARLAFDAGDTTSAKNIYEQIPKGSAAYEDGLDELAWTEVRNGRPDLASTNVGLLFALYPESRRLPNAGFLLGRIHQDRRSLEEGIATLEMLYGRFHFEEEATRRAIDAFQGREEEILGEFDPLLSGGEVRAILPTIGRKLLEQDPRIREPLAAIRSLRDQRREIEQGLGALQGAEAALRGEGSDGDTVVLLEWNVDLERRLLGVPAQGSPYAQTAGGLLSELDGLNESLRPGKDLLPALDRYIELNWKALQGEREKLALSAKTRIRSSAKSLEALSMRIHTTRDLVYGLGLRLRHRAAREEAWRLRPLRAGKPEMEGEFRRLDRLRETIEASGRKHRVAYRENLSPLRTRGLEKLARVTQAERSAAPQARAQIRSALAVNARKLASTLHRYLWSIAEARYAHFRAANAAVDRARKLGRREQGELEARLDPIRTGFASASERPPLSANEPAEIRRRVEETASFLQAAEEFAREADRRITTEVEKLRKRYSTFDEKREDAAISNREERREEALHVYRRLASSPLEDERAPYALFRLAQLYYERAETLARTIFRKKGLNDRAASEYRLALPPLDRLRQEYPRFAHRDSALYLLGYTRLETGDRPASLAAFEELVAKHPESPLCPEVHLRIGEHYFADRAFDRAIPHYQKVLSYGFNFFYDKALYKLAWSNYLTGHYDSAIAYFLILLDYDQELPEEQRKRFVEYSEEAQEYVAFSMFRSGGVPTAERVFGKVGWKSYGLPVLERMAEISRDRGSYDGAIAAYGLAAEKYPDSPRLPDLLEQRLSMMETRVPEGAVIAEKQRLYRVFSPDSSWRKQQAENRSAQISADRLLRRVTYSLATHYDVLAEKSASKDARAQRLVLYRETAERYPHTEEAYHANFRLAEIAFSSGQYAEAVRHYDVASRSDQYSAHFADCLFGTVVSHERLLAAETDPAASTQHFEDFSRAVDRFAARAPKDPRLPEVLFRKGTLLAAHKQYEPARSTFLQLARKYPKHPRTGPALLAATDTYVQEDKWSEAAVVAERLRTEFPDADPETRKQLAEVYEGARFKGALAAEQRGDFKAAADGYLAFQKDFPSSENASKALLNAFGASRRDHDVVRADASLSLLLSDYRKSPEATRAPLERALLWDAAFEPERAVSMYETALHEGLTGTDLEMAVTNLSALIQHWPKGNRGSYLHLLASRVSGKKKQELELIAAELAEDEGNPSLARTLYMDLERDPQTGALVRLRAQAELSRIRWDAGERPAAAKDLDSAARLFGRLKKDERGEATASMAWAYVARSRYLRRALEGTPLDTVSEASFARSLKKRADLLREIERTAADTLKVAFFPASAEALYEVGKAYAGTASILSALSRPDESLPVPAESISPLIGPLEQKARTFLRRSYDLLSEERLSTPYFNDLALLLTSLKDPIPPASESTPAWAAPYLPRLPPFLEIPTSEGKLLLSSSDLYSEKGQNEAEKTFSAALFASPGQPSASYNLALVRLIQGKSEEAGNLFRSSHSALPPTSALRFEATESYLAGRLEPAASLFERLAVEPSLDDDAAYNFALAKIAAGKPRDALSDAKRALWRMPQSLTAHRALAAAFDASGERSLSRLVLRRALTLHPKDAAAETQLALLLDDPADAWLRSTLLKQNRMSANPEALSNWAALAFGVRRYENAKDEWSRAYRAGGRHHPDIRKNQKRNAPSEGKDEKPAS